MVSGHCMCSSGRRGSNSNNSGSKSKTTNVNKKKQLKEKRRRTMLSPKTYPRPPAPALCGVEGADAISALLEFDMNCFFYEIKHCMGEI